MVYCTKCGTQNPDDAKICSKCGASLYAVGEREYYRHVERECFGIPRGGAIVAVAIGAIIVLWGLITVLKETNVIASNIDIWPIAVIIFGVLIVVGAIYGLRRR
jgi:uncharacterized membrane protein YvbJ